MAEIFCPNCGDERARDARFCGRCGHKFPGQAQPTLQAPPPVQQGPQQQQPQQQQEQKPQYGGIAGPILDAMDTMAKRKQWDAEQKRKREQGSPAPHGTTAFETGTSQQPQTTQSPVPQRPIQPTQTALSDIPQSNINIFEGAKFGVLFGIVCVALFPFIGVAWMYGALLGFVAFLLFSGILITFLGALKKKKKKRN